MTDGAGEGRGLTKRIAGTLTTGGVHPRAVRAGSRLHTWLFRWFGGAGFLGRDALLLTTTGRRSGRPRTTPLYYVRHGPVSGEANAIRRGSSPGFADFSIGVGIADGDRPGRRYYVAASFAGRDTPPGWFQNLVTDPVVTVQVRGERCTCRARVISAEEASVVWPLLDATYRPFARYRRRTRRVIPVIELTPTDPADPSVSPPRQPRAGQAPSRHRADTAGSASARHRPPGSGTRARPTGERAHEWFMVGEPATGRRAALDAESDGPTVSSARARWLADARSGRVVLVSHCLLNENTRYLGGATRPGCVAELVGSCTDAGLGMVQMPCPEQRVWGGVLKRRLLRTYGARWLRPGLVRRLLLPPALAYTRWRYRRIARQVAAQAADYHRAGMQVTAVIGVDGSPSCGVHRRLNTTRMIDGLSHADPDTLTTAQVNAMVRAAVTTGQGLYTQALRSALRRGGVDARFLAHDLLEELDGHPSTVTASIGHLTDGDHPAPG